ncbi:hypothetical protein B6D60_09885 [candidate division KSB1 bacterium 4484_87]|nr:MAG: hypothetical protein B6D60_09885 [candidate division KSB1 bacterium 4484_87]
MNRLFLSVIFFFLFSCSLLTAQNNQTTQKVGNLTVIVSGLKNNKGDVKIGLFKTKESYDGKKNKFKGAIRRIKNRMTKWEVKKIPFGEYAIKAFHDEDGDDEIDTNFLGMPTESFGFSNNARAFFGPPDFEKAKFLFNADSMRIEVKLR